MSKYCYIAACCDSDGDLRAVKISDDVTIFGGDLIRLDDGDLCSVVCATYMPVGSEEYNRIARVVELEEEWDEIYHHGGYRKGNVDAVS